MPEQEWYTLQDITQLTGIPYEKVRSAVFVLRNQGAIRYRSNPVDARLIEVHTSSLEAVKRALGL